MRIEVQVMIARDGAPGKLYRLVPVVRPGPAVEKQYRLRGAGATYTLIQYREPLRDGRRQVCTCPDANFHQRRCKHLVTMRAMGFFDQLFEPADLTGAPPAIECGTPPDAEPVEIPAGELVGAGT